MIPAWQFYIKYRVPNAIIVKNKYPIPITKDLFSKLAGAKNFTKIDLRFGYHQVRMKVGGGGTKQPLEPTKDYMSLGWCHLDSPMPFQLSKPSWIWSSSPFLRKSILLFCYDIMIYSSSWEEHVQHVRSHANYEVKSTLPSSPNALLPKAK